MSETVILSEEDSNAISTVRDAEKALNRAIRGLPVNINAQVTILDCRSIEQPPGRETIIVNLSRVL